MNHDKSNNKGMMRDEELNESQGKMGQGKQGKQKTNGNMKDESYKKGQGRSGSEAEETDQYQTGRGSMNQGKNFGKK